MKNITSKDMFIPEEFTETDKLMRESCESFVKETLSKKIHLLEEKRYDVLV